MILTEATRDRLVRAVAHDDTLDRDARVLLIGALPWTPAGTDLPDDLTDRDILDPGLAPAYIVAIAVDYYGVEAN